MNSFTVVALLVALVGTSVAVPSSRIVNGRVATPGQLPYQALIYAHTSKGVGLCGGALLNHEFVVTAAHCLLLADRYEIHLGAIDRTNLAETGRVVMNTTNALKHEKFNILAHNDIGLLRLPSRVEYSDRIQPVALPKDATNLFEGQVAVASGWGLTHDGKDQKPPTHLQYADLKVITNKECKKDYVFLVIKETTMCAKGEQMESTCNGDSGGPLVLKETNELIGLTSFGNKKGCEKGIPVGFTRVTKYLDWIRKHSESGN